jgi:hypothetical protein
MFTLVKYNSILYCTFSTYVLGSSKSDYLIFKWVQLNLTIVQLNLTMVQLNLTMVQLNLTMVQLNLIMVQLIFIISSYSAYIFVQESEF